MRRLLQVMVVLLAVVGATAVAAAPAQAHHFPVPAGCNNFVCLFDGNNGTFYMYGVNTAPGICHNLPASVNNKANGFANRLPNQRHVQFYDGANCTNILLWEDLCECGGPHPSGWHGNFYYHDHRGPGAIDHSNRVSSIFFNTFCTGC